MTVMTPQNPAPSSSEAIPSIPVKGGQIVIDKVGDRTIITSAAIPPDVLQLAKAIRDGTIGLMTLLAIIVILGPFARMIARRIERRHELHTGGESSQSVQQQLLHLQQSVDAISLEVERISEAQRFQAKLLNQTRDQAVS